MSFFETGEDDLVTVQEAIAFIDACEDVGAVALELSGVTSSSSDSEPRSPVDSASSEAETQTSPKAGLSVEKNAKQPPSRPRKSKNPSGYSTRLLRRKKAELQSLREEAAQLEDQLEQLKTTASVTRGTRTVSEELRTGSDSTAAKALQLRQKTQSKWLELALLEFQRRQQSERTNRKLRAILRSQSKTDDALRRVIQRPNVLEGMDFVMNTAPTMQSPLARMDTSSAIIAELEQKVANLYLTTSAVLPPLQEQREAAFSCDMHPVLDPQRGKVFEIVTSAPVPCAMHNAAAVLWEELCTPRKYPDKSYRYMRSPKANCVEKNFDTTLRTRNGAIPINGLQFMRKFEEPGRIVLVRAYHILFPSAGLHMRGHSWTTITPATHDPAGASVIRFFVQIFLERTPGFVAVEEDMRYVKEVGLASWSAMMRGHAQWLQEMVVEAAEQQDMGGIWPVGAAVAAPEHTPCGGVRA